MSLSKVILDLAISQIRSLLDIEKRIATETAKYQAAATQQSKELCPSPVSYTHLTLPTKA